MEAAQVEGGKVEAAKRREQWQRTMAEQRASGQTAAAYCRAHGLPTWKFAYWRKALEADCGPRAQAGGFVEIAATSRSTGVSVEAGRWRVHVEAGFDAATLRRAVEALAAS